jgi:hypothetical protein
MANDQFNPHTFASGAAVGSGALAFAMMASIHTAARNVRQVLDDQKAAVELQEFFDCVHKTVAAQERRIAEQASMIEALTELCEFLQRQSATTD